MNLLKAVVSRPKGLNGFYSMVNVFIIFAGLITLFCLYLVVVCLFAASREHDLPDIEDVETG